jgi:hypothetical protein
MTTKSYTITLAVLYATLILIILGLITFGLTGCKPIDIKGSQGTPGATVPVLTAPATSLQCSNGGMQVTVGTTITVICNGLNGLTGQTGATGSTGATGAAGTDASIQVVTFCPGVTTYPSAFLEVGLIINGNLYGVYSLNGGFLSELPPGNYTSDGVGASCNFTVNPDLSISY